MTRSRTRIQNRKWRVIVSLEFIVHFLTHSLWVPQVNAGISFSVPTLWFYFSTELLMIDFKDYFDIPLIKPNCDPFVTISKPWTWCLLIICLLWYYHIISMIYRLSISKNRKNVYATNVFDDIADLERRILRWTVYRIRQYRISNINLYIQNSTQK